MKTIRVSANPLDLSEVTVLQNESVCAALHQFFEGHWPSTARIYLGEIAAGTDITPFDRASVEALETVDGDIYVVVYPCGPIGLVTAIIIAVVAVTATVLLTPKPTIPSLLSVRNQQAGSPNNELSERKNSPRPGGRIPDIYGTVRSTPDLLTLPYTIFVDNEEIEYAYMCIGRGAYEINDVYDDTTAVSSILGESVEVFPPFNSPNSGSPQLTVGSAITEPLWSVTRSNAVNGQVLRPPNGQSVVGSSNIRFIYPNIIQISGAAGISFTDIFDAGDSIVVTNASFTDAPATPPPPSLTVDLAGTYVISSLIGTEITLTSPASINADWNDIALYTGGVTGYISPTIASSPTAGRWVGPFILTDVDLSSVYCNFVALNGLYKDDGSNQIRTDVEIQVGITPVNLSDVPIGAEQTFNITLAGSAQTTSTRADTLKATPSFQGRCSVRAKRVTDSDLAFVGTVVDEVKWRDLFSMTPVTAANFGNVTTVHSATHATAGALAVKDRKLNMEVTRKIPLRVSGSTFTGTLYPTNRADEILSAICLDEYIGRRTVNEVDFDNIYDTMADVEDYFGIDTAVEFCYTLDKDNLSFEEIAGMVASAVHCTAYRQGSRIKVYFEKETPDSTILFNHRNKIPGTETRSVSFGYQKDYDGVEYQYVDPADDAVVTYIIPEDGSAVNPQRVDSAGIRTKIQAYWQAYRLWNKIQHQRIALSFDATREADVLVLQNRILVADNTRPGTQDGEVESVDGLVLTLSQDVVLDPEQDYNIFLQRTDGTIESIAIEANEYSNEVVLAAPPSSPLSTDINAFAKCTYIIVGSDDVRQRAFLVSEKTSQEGLTVSMKAVNYDERYYSNDTDYINGIIDSNGDFI